MDNGLFSDIRCNWQGEIVLKTLPSSISYRYILLSECVNPSPEPGSIRILAFSKIEVGGCRLFEFNDLWRWNEVSQSFFAKGLFDKTLFRREPQGLPTVRCEPDSNADQIGCLFCAHCNIVGKAQCIRVVGSIPELGQWNPAKGIALDCCQDLQWTVYVPIDRSHFPFEFKLVATAGGSDPIIWETHGNRTVTISDWGLGNSVVIDCWYLYFPYSLYHGAGINIDMNVFDEFDFGSLIKVIDWCKAVGFSAIQIRNLFDTTAMIGGFGSLPVSGYAINPIFLDMCQFESLSMSLTRPRSAVLSDKISVLRECWQSANRAEYCEALPEFVDRNKSWLKDYEKLCYGRSKGQEFSEDVDPEFSDFVDFVQFLCHQQLNLVVSSARNRSIGIALELPFILSEKSAEAFGRPELFLQDYALGVPPSPENPIGEVLPAYPYDFSKATVWFHDRVAYFSQFVAIIRFESTIQFFKQWIVPRATSVTAVFGHFEPCVNLWYAELEVSSLWDVERYTQPYLARQHLTKLFGADFPKIQEIFFNANLDGSFAFKPEFSCERSLVEAVLPEEADLLRAKYRDALLRLLAEVLLIKVGENEYRPRPLFTLAAWRSEKSEKSFSFGDLPSCEQSSFLRLDEDYQNNRHICFWISKAREILSESIRGASAAFFSDACGQNGELCDKMLEGIGVHPLRVQLEGRSDSMFDDIRSYPYLCVASPQRDSSVPLRVVWEEDRVRAQKLWREEFCGPGEAPLEYTDEVALYVMEQHCWSVPMWIMFPVDCLMGAKKYIVHSDRFRYGILDWRAFLEDKEIQTKLREVLGRTNRRG
jgi:hypothetical protein